MSDNKANFVHVVPDSQYYVSLEQIKMNLEFLLNRFKDNRIDSGLTELEDDKYVTFIMSSTSAKEDLEYLIKGVENTSKKFKMIHIDCADSAKTNSSLQKDLNRVKKRATENMKRNTSRKKQIIQFNNLIRDLIKSERITKAEVSKYIGRDKK